MELSQSFTGLVFLVSAIHLAETFGRAFWARPMHIEKDCKSYPAQVRDDWYLFFHCSDLTGSTTSRPKKNNQRTSDQVAPNIPQSRPTRISVSY